MLMSCTPHEGPDSYGTSSLVSSWEPTRWSFVWHWVSSSYLLQYFLRMVTTLIFIWTHLDLLKFIFGTMGLKTWEMTLQGTRAQNRGQEQTAPHFLAHPENSPGFQNPVQWAHSPRLETSYILEALIFPCFFGCLTLIFYTIVSVFPRLVILSPNIKQ